MIKYLLLAATIILSGCTTMQSDDPDSLAFSLPENSILALNKTLTISSAETHGTIQAGKQIKDDDRNFYQVSCRLDFKKFGPRTIEPEEFTVVRTEDGSHWVSFGVILRFYTEIYLSSSKGTDVIKMVCQQYGDQFEVNFTVAEMQAALADFISFKYTEK